MPWRVGGGVNRWAAQWANCAVPEQLVQPGGHLRAPPRREGPAAAQLVLLAVETHRHCAVGPLGEPAGSAPQARHELLAKQAVADGEQRHDDAGARQPHLVHAETTGTGGDKDLAPANG